MAEFVFARQFLTELAEWEGASSPADREQLDAALASIGQDPALSGRVPTFYDPARPSYLYRAGPVLLHYRVEKRTVAMLNMFFQRLR